MDSQKSQDPTTVVQDNNMGWSLKGGNSKTIGGMWNLKHVIVSLTFYEILIKIELKGNTSMDLENFYNFINMFIGAVNRLQEDLLPAYQYIKRHS